jgi:SAM-dependent methyltransferase
MVDFQAQQGPYWEKAGEIGYAEAVFRSQYVARHVNGRLWGIAVEIGKQLGLDASSHVLDLGCGDGAFSNQVLAQHFHAVDGFDLSEAGINRARNEAPKPTMRFEVCDIPTLDFGKLPRYDGAFLIGILHHIKASTPAVVRSLRDVTDRVVVWEPNGNNLVRRLLEFTPSYRRAGEASFTTKGLQRVFHQAGFRTVVWRRASVFPAMLTPKWFFKLFSPVEPWIESTPVLRALCGINLFGFVSDKPR